MATQPFTGSFLLSNHRQALASFLSRSLSSSAPASAPRCPLSLPSLLRHCLLPLSAEFHRRVAAASSARSFATRSKISNPNPNWSNRPPKEKILLDGRDLDSWLVVMEQPEGDPTRRDIMDSYVKTLAQVVGSEEAAQMSIYLASTGQYFFGFAARLTNNQAYILKNLPRVEQVVLDQGVKNNDHHCMEALIF